MTYISNYQRSYSYHAFYDAGSAGSVSSGSAGSLGSTGTAGSSGSIYTPTGSFATVYDGSIAMAGQRGQGGVMYYPDGAFEHMSVDDNGNTVQVRYDKYGNVTGKAVTNKTEDEQTFYDASGKKTGSKTIDGCWFIYYDSKGKEICREIRESE